MVKDFANLKKYASQNLEITGSSAGKIIFIGDSITEFWRTADLKFFDQNLFINRGISGQTTSQILLRFQNDVVNLMPSTVIILAGINDIAQNNGPISLEKSLNNIVEMVKIAQKNKINVILCSLLPANRFSWRTDILPAKIVVQLNEIIKDYASRNNIIYADFYKEMVDENHGLDKKFGTDGVHPNLNGYKTMEIIILKSIQSLLTNLS